MTARLVGAKFFHAKGWTDEQTGMMKIMVAFRNYVNVPKYND